MITISDFDKQISGTILQRGKDYFKSGAVLEIEEIEKGLWQAEVEGTENYEVSIKIKNSNNVEKCFCSCPYDDAICKHVIAVLYGIREKNILSIDTPKERKNNFNKLIDKLTPNEIKSFIKDYATKHKDFKTALELTFADKDNNFNLIKTYQEIVKKIFQKNSSRGFIDYRSSLSLAKDLNKVINEIKVIMVKGNLTDAFKVSANLLEKTMTAITYADDSSGSLGDTISESIELINSISEKCPLDLKELIFNYLNNEFKKEIYFDYGDFGYEMFEIFYVLAINLSKSEEFLKFIDDQIATLNGPYGEHRKSFMQRSKIAFLKETGNIKEADQLIQQNLEIVEIRQVEVDKFIFSKNFINAKKLINDGIKIAENKNHSGTVSQWQQQLLRIAELENDVQEIRKHNKYFALNGGFSENYYKKWKATFTQNEWINIIEEHINETIKKVNNDYSKRKHNSWFTYEAPLLNNVASIYIQENYMDRLWELVKLQKNLDTIMSYHTYLLKDYQSELLEIYLPALEANAKGANDRSSYKELVKKMMFLAKTSISFNDAMVNKAIDLKNTYFNRPAMLDELRAILKG
jgi:hypothetical protein